MYRETRETIHVRETWSWLRKAVFKIVQTEGVIYAGQPGQEQGSQDQLLCKISHWKDGGTPLIQATWRERLWVYNNKNNNNIHTYISFIKHDMI